MRGKGGRTGSSGRYTGITPARAGKRPKSRKNGPNTWDHLRVCGEKQSGADQQTTIEGSPPRMRGKDQACSRWRYPDGITPAYAGKSSSRRQRMPHSRDHPRLCGEKLERSDPRFPSRGSPLRVRGKVGPVIQLRAGPGITPACAGKSRNRCEKVQRGRDHPRMCGEKLKEVVL